MPELREEVEALLAQLDYLLWVVPGLRLPRIPLPPAFREAVAEGAGVSCAFRRPGVLELEVVLHGRWRVSWRAGPAPLSPLRAAALAAILADEELQPRAVAALSTVLTAVEEVAGAAAADSLRLLVELLAQVEPAPGCPVEADDDLSVGEGERVGRLLLRFRDSSGRPAALEARVYDPWREGGEVEVRGELLVSRGGVWAVDEGGLEADGSVRAQLLREACELPLHEAAAAAAAPALPLLLLECLLREAGERAA